MNEQKKAVEPVKTHFENYFRIITEVITNSYVYILQVFSQVLNKVHQKVWY